MQAAGAPAAAVEHKAKKQKVEQQQQQQGPQQGPQHNQAAAAGKPGMEPRQQPHKNAVAAAASDAKSKLGSSKTKFYEMLEADGVSAAAAAGAASKNAFLADLRMEREMARKLKIKKVGNCAISDARRGKSADRRCRCSCNIACRVAKSVCLFGRRWNHLWSYVIANWSSMRQSLFGIAVPEYLLLYYPTQAAALTTNESPLVVPLLACSCLYSVAIIFRHHLFKIC